jgi:hypothetical protein
MALVKEQNLSRRGVDVPQAANALPIETLPLKGRVASIDDSLGMAIVMDEVEEHAWAFIKEDAAPELWKSLVIGSQLAFMDNGHGCIEKARLNA